HRHDARQRPAGEWSRAFLRSRGQQDILGLDDTGLLVRGEVDMPAFLDLPDLAERQVVGTTGAKVAHCLRTLAIFVAQNAPHWPVGRWPPGTPELAAWGRLAIGQHRG